MTDPGFLISETRAAAEAAARVFDAAGDLDAILDGFVLLMQIEVNLAHWSDAAKWARLGLDRAAANAGERQREEFAAWLSNALLWGSTDARESLATMEGLLDSVTRRLVRSTMLGAIAVMRALVNDREGAEQAEADAASIRQELGVRRSEFRHTYMAYALADLADAARLARVEAVELEKMGDTGQRSTMVGFESWIHALLGNDEEALRCADESRALGAPDDAVTQILLRAGESVALARLGRGADADRVSSEGVEIAAGTDSMDTGTAWEARATTLSILGRTDEARVAAERARVHYTARGSVTPLRRIEALIAG
jgi:hypothetical protein